jgi:hypothetical protein
MSDAEEEVVVNGIQRTVDEIAGPYIKRGTESAGKALKETLAKVAVKTFEQIDKMAAEDSFTRHIIDGALSGALDGVRRHDDKKDPIHEEDEGEEITWD